VRDPIGDRGRVIHPLSVALTQSNMAPTPALKAPPTAESAGVFDFTGAKERLCAGDGGYETVHESRGLQVYVYVLVAPEPDHERVNAHSKIYIVLEGRGVLNVDGERLALREGRAAFVPAHANHVFSAYEYLTVLAIRSGSDVGL
jgi:mannose-6-phosphate isomerase-like protein (cupin superfamily)